MSNKIIKKKFGYYQLRNKPTKKSLSDYYANLYYQQYAGSYESEYSDTEVKYIKNKQRYLELCLKRLIRKGIKGKKFLDIGCGEGWTLSHFLSIGCNVKGVDFSSLGIEKFNPEVSKYFVKEDIYLFLEKEIRKSNKYDIINLTNVIEHVLEPEDLLVGLKTLLKPFGILVVTFPNDFSNFQKLLLELGKVAEEFWILPPDHISYFTKDSFLNLTESLGMFVEFILADFPIDIFLINDYSNYVKNKSKGKQAHLARLFIMNFLFDQNFEQTVEIILKFGRLGFGRNLTAFLRIKK